MATNTISGTAMNTPLKEVPMAINVITAEFLADSLVGNFEQALDYNSAITQTSRLPVNNRNDAFAIRGFRNRNTLVDGVITGEFIPPQMIDRIEIVKGPNTLYGQSDPGGLINVISKRPQGGNRLSLGLRAGDNGLFGADFDGNVVAGNGRLGLRLVGAHNTTDGYRTIDGNDSTFLGVAGDVKLAQDTTAVFHVSGSETDGISSQRSTFSFELIPTDLNRDGRIDTTVVNGITETTARYNNTFLPRDYTSATDATRYEQESKFLQFGLRQRLGRHANIQYMFVRTDQDMDMTFREFNTFNPAGSSDANHSAQTNSNRTDVHTLNSLVTVTTGPLTHRLLVGARYSWDQTEGATHSLRTLGPGTERATLDRLISQGRRIRLFLTKNDVLSGVKYWLDDTPTAQEMRTLGTRGGNVYVAESRVSSAYISDSIAMLNNRLKLLTGLRYVRIRSQSTDLAGVKIGRLNDQDNTSYQVGATYDLTTRIAAYANTATAFNPNGFDWYYNAIGEPPGHSNAIYRVGGAFKTWKNTPIEERRAAIMAISGAIKENAEELYRLLTSEQGKPHDQARGEIYGAAGMSAAQSTLSLEDEINEDSDTRLSRTRRVPVGVVGGIVPWNFPVMMAIQKIVPVSPRSTSAQVGLRSTSSARSCAFALSAASTAAS